MKRLVAIIAVVALLFAALVGWNFFSGWKGEGPLEADKTVLVAQGSSLSATADLLEKEGVVASSDAFLNRVRIFGSSEPIKAGEFLFPAKSSNSEVFAILTGGVGKQYMITIPEGMPSILVYEKLTAEKSLKGDIPVPAEGSVLPETYSFQKGEPRADVLKRMQAAMTETLDELWKDRSKNTIAKNKREAVILASIVEKETAKASERKLVASVYSNRLRKDMMLQADPTIIYPITKGKPLGRRIRQSEIAEVNDYNTYAMTGLPKGPIANPGRESIAAVLDPAQSTALFFVADGKGGHIFADTYEEHQANVEKWYALRRERGEM